MRHSSGQIRQVAGCVSPELGKEVGLVIKIWELSECKFMPRLWVGCLHENQAERGRGQSRLMGDLAAWRAPRSSQPEASGPAEPSSAFQKGGAGSTCLVGSGRMGTERVHAPSL